MTWPVLVINLKQHITGKKVVDYCEQLATLSAQHSVRIAVCPPVADLDKARAALNRISGHRLLLFSQKIDNVTTGDSKTGSVGVDSIKETADGTLLNHYETRIYQKGEPIEKKEELLSIIKKAADAELKIIVCVDSAETAAQLAPLLPASCAIAIEWDTFIGQRISIVKEKRSEVEKAIHGVKKIRPEMPVYAGAGVEEAEDIIKVLKMDGAGVLAATAFTKAPRYQGDTMKAIGEVLERIQKFFG